MNNNKNKNWKFYKKYKKKQKTYKKKNKKYLHYNLMINNYRNIK